MNQKMGIWIDQSKAALVVVEEDQTKMKTIVSPIALKPRNVDEFGREIQFGHQHPDDDRHRQNKRMQQKQKFVKIIAEEIGQADEVVVLGPAEMKIELQKFIEGDKELSARLKSVENADKMTDNQLIAWVKEYFKK
jgi:stalled ribosome rescue protein Dom34